MISEQFFGSIGSVMGSYHRNSYKNNQDAGFIAENESGLMAVVTDGCGSGKYSEVGARLVARFLCHRGLELLVLEKNGMEFRDGLLEELRREALNFVKQTAQSLGGSFSQVINDYFLFTVIGAVITDEKVLVFSLGDGCFSVNGQVTVVDQDNLPRYLAYALVSSVVLSEDKHFLDFQTHVEMGIDELDSLVLATDGATDLQDRAEESISILGEDVPVGDLTQFETNPKYLKNASLLQKDLVVRGVNKGILRDDTTVILIKRRPEKED